MYKYYWFVNADTDVMGGYMGNKSLIKRAISPPIGRPYVIETVNGYNHSLKENNGGRIAEINDAGNISEINGITSLIANQLAKMIENERKKKNQSKPNTIDIDELMRGGSSLYLSEDMDMASAWRRKKRIKARLNRSSIKKKITKKRK
jgi:hypothetical protein